MVHPEELQKSDQDDGACQEDEQPSIDQEIPGREQTSSPEEERPGEQYQNSHDNQGMLFDEESPQEMMRMEEPGAQPPDEVGALPGGRGELIDPTMEPVDQETPDRLPTDQPEREAVPVTLDGPK